MTYLRLHTLTLLVLCLSLLACASSTPKITVLGVKAPKAGARTVKVFVEVLNPTSQALSLKRLEYRFSASEWIDATGKVSVTRNVAAGSKAVVEIQVPLTEMLPLDAQNMSFQLDARLVGVTDKGERAWKVQANGALNPNGNSRVEVAAQR